MNRDPVQETVVTEFSHIKFFSWSAIVIGALIAIGLNFLLYVLSSGIGLTAFTTSTTGLVTLAMGGFIWLVLVSYFAMFVAGWITGAIASPFILRGSTGVLHGFAAWCLALIITAALFSQSLTAAVGTPIDFKVNPTSPVVTSHVTTEKAKGAETRELTAEETKDAANKLGIGVLAVFFIFLAGAVGSCVGGYLGGQSGDYFKATRERKR